jgi:hypothetical protein
LNFLNFLDHVSHGEFQLRTDLYEKGERQEKKSVTGHAGQLVINSSRLRKSGYGRVLFPLSSLHER